VVRLSISKKSIFLAAVSLFLFFSWGCSHSLTKSGRHLSEAEMQRLNLNGILYDADLCPNAFDDKTKTLKVVGPCEVVNCEVVNKKTECYAYPKSSKAR